jgi:uridine monophosphate synthetase
MIYRSLKKPGSDFMEEENSRLSDDLVSLALTLFDIGAVRFGEFSLHSGRTSPIYIDLRLLASFPDALRQAAAVYATLLDKMKFDLLAATPLAGLPIGTAISLEMNVPLVYARTTAKGYGTGKKIEGKWEAGQRAVMVDDLITSGDSLLRGIKMLTSAGLVVTQAVVLLDREQGGREVLESQGYTLSRAMTLGQVLAVYEAERRISAEQRANVLDSLT